MQRILIVEDDITSRMLLRILLKSCNKEIEVIEVKNGEEALKELESKTFNLLLLDIVMPIMNGKELMKEIKSKTKYNHMSIIAITTDGTTKTEMYDLGIDDFIEKPLKKDKLIEKISKRLL